MSIHWGGRGPGHMSRNTAPRTNASQALRSAKSRPVDMVMIGDSLQLSGGYGWDAGLAKAFGESAAFGLWATPLYSQVSTGTGYSNQGYLTSNVAGATGVHTGADAAFDTLQLPNYPYFYTASGDLGTSNGISITDPGVINVNANLRYTVNYGTLNSGSGSFRLGARIAESPFTNLAIDSAVISTNTGSIGEASLSIDLPAATRNYDLQFALRRPGGTASVGPTIFMGQRVENLDKTNGMSFHSFYGVSGVSMWDLATFFQDTTNAARTTWGFGKLRQAQIAKGFTPRIVFRVCSGFNDRSEASTPTKGPAAIATANASQTQAGYADNLRGLISAIEAAYLAAGGSLSELFFWIVTPYPITSGDADLAPFRAGADEVAGDNTRYQHFNYADYFDFGDIATSDGVHFTTASTDTACAAEFGAIA